MRLGIFAKTFAGTDPHAVLAAARQAGYPCVQYNMACSGLSSMPDAVPEGTAGDLAEASERTGVAIAAISATYNMIHPDPAVRERGHASLERIAAVARDVGAPLLTLCTGTRDPDDQWRHHPDNATPEAWRDLVASMGTALDIAERYRVDLGIEPELANVVNSAAAARRLIDELASERLKVVLDPANLYEAEPIERQRAIVSGGIDLLADRIAMAHAKDRNAKGDFVTAGTGVLDYPFYIGKLRDIGFAGPLVTHGLSAQEAPTVARFLGRVLAGGDESPVNVPTHGKRPRLAVADRGTGSTVLFQHGLCGDARQPAEVFPLDLFRCLTVECRGHGASEAGEAGDFAIATFADDVATVLEARGLGPLPVGGISMGAAIALRLAVTRPDLVSALVLARPAWMVEAAPPNMVPNAVVGRLLSTFDGAEARDRFEATATAKDLADHAPDNLASLRSFFSREPRHVTAELLMRISADGPGVTLDQVRALRIPTLVIGHDRDTIHPLDLARRLASTIPGAELSIIPPKADDLDGYRKALRSSLATFLQECSE